MRQKIVGRGRTYPFRDWFRKSGFAWNKQLRHWEKESEDCRELERLALYAVDRFELIVDEASSSENVVQRHDVDAVSPSEFHVPPWATRQPHRISKNVPAQPTSKITIPDPTNQEVDGQQGVAVHCLVCGSFVPAARIAAVPATRLCLIHASERGVNGIRKIHEPWGSRDAWKKDRSSWKKIHT